MNEPYHRSLAGGRWHKLSIIEQLANVGSEVERAISWRERGEQEYFQRAFDRMLELLDLTIADSRWRERARLKEVVRLREVLCDFFCGENIYQTTPDYLRRYFLQFGIAARSNR